MKFTLKDYQTDAVRDALVNLKKARKRWHEDNDKHAFSLTAVTGAGKTVMAAATFEALFHGDDEFDFDADPGAVVIWFSDDPSLNEQTRFRLIEASDRIQHTDLVVVEHPFSRAKFEAKKIYFLNTQKLGKNSLLVRGFDGEDLVTQTRPDAQAFTIWDTIRNTIEDSDLTLYLVLDEAHRGMGNPSKASESAKSTIVQRLINGLGGIPGIPVVWGISATVERFKKAMEGAQKRITLPDVVVDSTKVQESGLIKDTIILDIPDEVGDFDTVLVRRATDKLKAVSEAWSEYAKQQDDSHQVIPLMVLQVPNTPDPNDIGRALDTIYQQWPELPGGCIAHVFGEHTTQQFGNRNVPYISPERVQESTWVRILIAKDAISTGWDCPRAEVMVSFRSAVDRTHITQLMGRMVRSPLARRIPGNERLNSVDCLLPKFDVKTVTQVVDALMKGDDTSPPPSGRVLINPVEMKPNPAATPEVWEKFEALPSQTRPQRGAKPAKRLTALAHELAVDGILAGAGKIAHAEMHNALDTIQDKLKAVIEQKRNAVVTVDGKSVVADLKGKTKTFNEFLEAADMAVINDAFRRAARIFSPDISRTYVDALAYRAADPDDEDEFDAALVDGRVSVAALGLVTEAQLHFDAEADRLAKRWLEEYGPIIKKLSHDRQESYRQIREMSTEPQDVDLVKPDAKYEPTKARENDVETSLPTYKNHLLCDASGNYPAELNAWEEKVVVTEMKRDGFSFWYRNPQQPGQSSLGIAYLSGEQYGIIRPDFIFFASLADGTIVADIVDPHGLHLADALPKLQGLALYAEKHATVFRRLESVAEAHGKLRVLDLMNEAVRKAIAEAKDATSLFAGMLASDYQ
ncbi:type III restriction endonuclease subunit R [Dechloromonas sp. TW-R-39-2]|uniref:DEAD/DEAH box helicase n=1 Tax=Dechloromonas sp. TW-R-39-2 TaxID=2654218 RepID=UPI00193E1A7F|nr:DEAD/DEAH box helicase family protein [Dechloromonas sp. TW-R-39-2]QRM20762.1 type III restriction endonuclease subunit R [Dechloromonas sp. TW-R-39-2]